MSRSRTMRYYAAASAVIPAAAVFLWNERLWVHAAFLVWLLLAAVVWIAEERKEQALRSKHSIQAMQISALRMLDHHRHDWMNDLQVLYGYIRLGKPDKTVQSVERIRERMAQESKIAKLGSPSLILFIQSFRTITSSLQLNVSVEGEVVLASLPAGGETTSETLIDLIHAYRMAAKPGTGDAAKLDVAFKGLADKLRVSFHYEGELTGSEELRGKIMERLKGSALHQINLDPGMKLLEMQIELGN
jgi:stage 0 sporulation protein B (sporulation initiation phosphotransferase)